MGRKVKLDEEKQSDILVRRELGDTVKMLAERYKVTTLTIYKVINRKGAYAVKPQILGQPILDINGQVVNIV